MNTEATIKELEAQIDKISQRRAFVFGHTKRLKNVVKTSQDKIRNLKKQARDTNDSAHKAFLSDAITIAEDYLDNVLYPILRRREQRKAEFEKSTSAQLRRIKTQIIDLVIAESNARVTRKEGCTVRGYTKTVDRIQVAFKSGITKHLHFQKAGDVWGWYGTAAINPRSITNKNNPVWYVDYTAHLPEFYRERVNRANKTAKVETLGKAA